MAARRPTCLSRPLTTEVVKVNVYDGLSISPSPVCWLGVAKAFLWEQEISQVAVLGVTKVIPTREEGQRDTATSRGTERMRKTGGEISGCWEVEGSYS